MCLHTTTTQVLMDVEVYDAQAMPAQRLRGASWYTCTGCGASFYRPAEWYGLQMGPIGEREMVTDASLD